MAHLIFVGGPGDALPAIGKAYALGYKVTVVDGDNLAPGMRWARKYRQAVVHASTYDPDEIASKLKPADYSGALAVACDVGPVVAQVAKHFDLPHIPVETCKLSWNKIAFKRKLAAAGLHVPQLLSDYQGEIVIKPVDGRGARGVSVLFDGQPEQLRKALRKAKLASPSNTWLVERYISGPQVSAEVLIYDRTIMFAGLTDRDYSKSLTVESGGHAPSQFEFSNVKYAIADTLQQAVSALDVRLGTVKFDLVIHRYQVYIIEAAIGRLSGGLSCSHYIPLGYGVDFLRAAFLTYEGQYPHLEPLRRGYQVTGQYEKAGQDHTKRGKLCLKLY